MQQIFVHDGTTTVTVTVPRGALVRHLEQALLAKRGLPIERQRLTFAGKILSSAQLLSDYNVQQRSTVELSGRISMMQVFVHAHDKVLTVAVPSDGTVLQVQNSISAKLGFPVESQRLTYVGKTLSSELPLATYNIQQRSTIDLSFRFPKPVTTDAAVVVAATKDAERRRDEAEVLAKYASLIAPAPCEHAPAERERSAIDGFALSSGVSAKAKRNVHQGAGKMTAKVGFAAKSKHQRRRRSIGDDEQEFEAQ